MLSYLFIHDLFNNSGHGKWDTDMSINGCCHGSSYLLTSISFSCLESNRCSIVDKAWEIASLDSLETLYLMTVTTTTFNGDFLMTNENICSTRYTKPTE